MGFYPRQEPQKEMLPYIDIKQPINMYKTQHGFNQLVYSNNIEDSDLQVRLPQEEDGTRLGQKKKKKKKKKKQAKRQTFIVEEEDDKAEWIIFIANEKSLGVLGFWGSCLG